MNTATHKTYDRVLGCAAMLFDRDGYESVSIEAICKEAGIGKSTFYSYFSSKEELAYSFFANELIFSPRNMVWILSAATPTERMVRAHICYMRHPTPACGPDVYLARCQYMVTHANANIFEADSFFYRDICLPLAEQARTVGELMYEGDLGEMVNAFSLYHFGWDITWSLSGRTLPYAEMLAKGFKMFYQLRPDIPVEKYIEECMKG